MARIKKIQAEGSTIYPATITNAIKDPATGELLHNILAEKADKKGKYPELISGYTYEIIGDGQATEEEFSYRPTAGEDRNVATTKIYDDDIKYGAAQIKTLKGNSVVWNQLFDPSTNDRSYNEYGVYITDNKDGSYSISTVEGGATQQVSRSFTTVHNLSYAGHKLLITGCDGAVVGLGFWDSYSNTIGTIFENNVIVSATKNGEVAFSVVILAGHIVPQTTWKPRVYDLTQMFGAGNEPTTVEEFYERLPKGVNLDAYNEGEIIDGNYGAVKTTGVNQYNGTFAKVIGGLTYYLGGTYTSAGFTTTEGGPTEVISIPSDKLYTPTQNGYIYAQGSDICISLVWPEYGEFKNYEPYKPFVRDLSWVNKYFLATINGETQYGMRSAGSAKDEIRFNSTTQKWEAVQRVGVVDLGSLTWELNPSVNSLFYARNLPNKTGINLLCPLYTTVDNIANINVMGDGTIKTHSSTSGFIYIKNSAYTDVATFKAAMQGVMLNYELATPIINEITENVNLAYDVSDLGTEELLVLEGNQSAPLVADIVYEPNVLASSKQIPDILKRLASLEAALALATTTTNIETTEE